MTEIIANTYYARVHVSRAGDPPHEVDVDARPSDAINLAVRFGAPVYISKKIAGGAEQLDLLGGKGPGAQSHGLCACVWGRGRHSEQQPVRTVWSGRQKKGVHVQQGFFRQEHNTLRGPQPAGSSSNPVAASMPARTRTTSACCHLLTASAVTRCVLLCLQTKRSLCQWSSCRQPAATRRTQTSCAGARRQQPSQKAGSRLCSCYSWHWRCACTGIRQQQQPTVMCLVRCP